MRRYYYRWGAKCYGRRVLIALFLVAYEKKLKKLQHEKELKNIRKYEHLNTIRTNVWRDFLAFRDVDSGA